MLAVGMDPLINMMLYYVNNLSEVPGKSCQDHCILLEVNGTIAILYDHHSTFKSPTYFWV